MIQNFWTFALMALMLNLTPGNDMLYVIARSSSQGTKAGVISSLGIMAGCMVHIMAAVVGLSAIVVSSALAFTVIKYLGVAYLIYLGVRSLIDQSSLSPIKAGTRLSYSKIFWQGALTNVLNPKVALFFLAFLPQFIIISATGVWLSILLLGSWFNMGGTLVNIVVAVIFGRIGSLLARYPSFVQWQKRITGGILIALGIRLALSSKK